MLIGLTGPIGAGKSTVLRMLEKLGAAVVSADHLVHQALEEPEIKKEVAELFGQEVLTSDGHIDRARLAREVFSSEEKRRRLEALLHPLVYEEIRRLHEQDPGRILVAEIPLLVESGGTDLVDLVLVVTSSPETAERRLLKRGMNIQEIQRRRACQLPQEEKLKAADYVIENDADLNSLEQEVKRFWDLLKKQEEKARQGSEN